MKARLWVILGIFILVLPFVFSSCKTIEAGHLGVLFRPFGGGVDTKQTYGEGFHLIAPWNSLIEYDVRLQEKEEAMDVLARNGLNIHIDVSVRFAPVASELPLLHREIGPDYMEKIVLPQIRASTRKVIGKYLPEELYSTKRDQIQEEIYHETDSLLRAKHIHLDAVLIRSVKLPQSIAEAIERKLRQEQEAMEYEFRIQKEQKEAERKRIEALGIKQFQDIVSSGLNPYLLRWKGIEATQALANSQNTKIIIIGSPKDGLPLILGE
ncbi:MAG: prohibitin family protein [Bacteroidia bacterium]|jgi:regulator of protease activity HflC (stomatin/prohibitin superfamily)|nr:prohibitin family protein [Bacteroidia bacterium]